METSIDLKKIVKPSSTHFRVVARKSFGDYVDMWGLQRLHNRDWGTNRLATLRMAATGKNVDIYIVDSGIASHTEFEELDSGNSRVQFLFDAYDETGQDRLGHGTFMASIAAGRTVGVASAANIFNVKVFDKEMQCAESDLLAGLQAVLNHHQSKAQKNPSILNLSLSVQPSFLVDTKIRDLVAAGVTVVAASGWHAADVGMVSPAGNPEVITVAASDMNDVCVQENNSGKGVDFFAPGVDIEGANLSDFFGYRSLSGSSISSAYAAGVSALVLEQNPKLGFIELKKILIESSLKNVLKSVPAQTPNRLLQNPMMDLGPKWNEGQQSLLGVFGWGQEVEIDLTLEESGLESNLPKITKGILPPGLELRNFSIIGKLPETRPADLIKHDENLDYFNLLLEVENEFGKAEKLFFIVVTDPVKLKDFDLTKANIAHVQKGFGCIASAGSGSGTS